MAKKNRKMTTENMASTGDDTTTTASETMGSENTGEQQQTEDTVEQQQTEDTSAAPTTETGTEPTTATETTGTSELAGTASEQPSETVAGAVEASGEPVKEDEKNPLAVDPTAAHGRFRTFTAWQKKYSSAKRVTMADFTGEAIARVLYENATKDRNRDVPIGEMHAVMGKVGRSRLSTYRYDFEKYLGAVIAVTRVGRQVAAYRLLNPERFVQVNNGESDRAKLGPWCVRVNPTILASEGIVPELPKVKEKKEKAEKPIGKRIAERRALGLADDAPIEAVRAARAEIAAKEAAVAASAAAALVQADVPVATTETVAAGGASDQQSITTTETVDGGIPVNQEPAILTA